MDLVDVWVDFNATLANGNLRTSRITSPDTWAAIESGIWVRASDAGGNSCIALVATIHGGDWAELTPDWNTFISDEDLEIDMSPPRTRGAEITTSAVLTTAA
jgi:hypothetical protein